MPCSGMLHPAEWEGPAHGLSKLRDKVSSGGVVTLSVWALSSAGEPASTLALGLVADARPEQRAPDTVGTRGRASVRQVFPPADSPLAGVRADTQVRLQRLLPQRNCHGWWRQWQYSSRCECWSSPLGADKFRHWRCNHFFSSAGKSHWVI
jgi:hypothetical protein